MTATFLSTLGVLFPAIVIARLDGAARQAPFRLSCALDPPKA
jgi:hypothetical protein